MSVCLSVRSDDSVKVYRQDTTTKGACTERCSNKQIKQTKKINEYKILEKINLNLGRKKLLKNFIRQNKKTKQKQNTRIFHDEWMDGLMENLIGFLSSPPRK